MACWATLVACTPRVAPLQRAVFAIRAGRILDPQTGRYSAPSVILVSGGKVTKVIPAAAYKSQLADSTACLRHLRRRSPHGRNADEFVARTQAGVSPLDAIRAATVTFALADSTVSLGVGMAADLIAVTGDPLTGLSPLSNPRFVMSRGRVVRP